MAVMKHRKELIMIRKTFLFVISFAVCQTSLADASVTRIVPDGDTFARAKAGDALSQIILGGGYLDGTGVTQDYKQAVYWYTKAAEQGATLGQYNLGIMYEKGEGVTQDYKQAVYWFTKAAERGEDDAQCELGAMYEKGEGVTQDYKQAFYWWSKAAEQGVTGTQYNLGLMYANGEGVTQNNNKAYVWFSIAAANGNKAAAKDRDFVATKLTPGALEKAQAEAAELQKKIEQSKAVEK
jgi:TPR repeat protein